LVQGCTIQVLASEIKTNDFYLAWEVLASAIKTNNLFYFMPGTVSICLDVMALIDLLEAIKV
jgi:hypothetical protein